MSSVEIHNSEEEYQLPSDCIEQKGRVISQTGRTVQISIMAHSACNHCAAKGSCNAFDSQEKILYISTQDHFTEGEEVTIEMQRKLGARAVLLGFTVPLLILVAIIVAAYALLGNEGIAALIGIIFMVLYYLGLYQFRGRLERTFTMRVKRLVSL